MFEEAENYINQLLEESDDEEESVDSIVQKILPTLTPLTDKSNKNIGMAVSQAIKSFEYPLKTHSQYKQIQSEIRSYLLK